MWNSWTLDQYNANLTGYWPLSETSGTRYDFTKAIALNDVNTVGWTTGVGGSGVAALFTAASSESLQGGFPAFGHARNFAVSMWVRTPPSWTAGDAPFSTGTGTAAHTATAFIDGTNHWRISIYDAALSEYADSGTVTVTANTWYHLLYVHSWPTSRGYLYVNGALDCEATLSGTERDSARLVLGGYYYLTALAGAWNGAVQHVAVWSDFPAESTADWGTLAAALYNAGTPATME
jgi:hypothetical protein